MLLISGWKNDEWERELKTYEWHLGQPVPNFDRVVEFKADGDELRLFQLAMHATTVGDYKKQKGFEFKPHPWDCKCDDHI